MRRPAHRLVLAVVVGALALGAAGCGSDDSSADPAPSPSASPTDESTSPSPTPSETTPSETASPTPEPSPTGVGALSGRLLSAEAMPGFNGPWRWSVRDTTTDPVKVGACLRIPMETVGADQVVTRRFVPTGDDGGGTATQVVATFVDERSADQAASVLDSSRSRCAASATKGAKVSVGRPQTVAVDRGEASWYLTTIVENGADEGQFNALGVLRDGLTIELVEYDSVGQDYSYASGREPAARALVAAAKLLP